MKFRAKDVVLVKKKIGSKEYSGLGIVKKAAKTGSKVDKSDGTSYNVHDWATKVYTI